MLPCEIRMSFKCNQAELMRCVDKLIILGHYYYVKVLVVHSLVSKKFLNALSFKECVLVIRFLYITMKLNSH